MKNYHFCISSRYELIFRTEDDYVRGFNTLAIVVSETGACLSAEAFMSTHVHVCVRVDDIHSFIYRFWRSYTRYYNSKYHRKGTLGDTPFVVEIDGFYHWLTAICYVMRNPVHHGVSSTPFAYRHCSANSIFKKETGQSEGVDCLPRKSYYKFLPKGVCCPQEYLMDSTGMIKRETVLDLADIEHRFVSPRSFIYYMNRLSGEEWKREQDKDNNNVQLITLESIECNATSQTLSEMLNHEHGRSNYRGMTDIELCTIVDRDMLSVYGKKSVYELTETEKRMLFKCICSDYVILPHRIRRCLVWNSGI